MDKDFSISKVSFGSILTPVGCSLLLYGFASYIQVVPGSDLSSLLLIYGFVGGLLGFALLFAHVLPRGASPVLRLSPHAPHAVVHQCTTCSPNAPHAIAWAALSITAAALHCTGHFRG